VSNARVDAEIERLVEGDKGKAHLAQAIRFGLRTWDELQKKSPAEAKWLLLDAYIARTDVSHEWSSPIRAERLEWARSVTHRLLREHGQEVAEASPEAMRVIRRLLPKMAEAIDATRKVAA
jgi:hypothetical protein